VLDGAGEPVPDAMVESWQAGTAAGFVRSGTENDGWFELVTAKPPAAGGAPHLTLAVFARGLLKQVVTRLYFPDEEAANATDPVLSALDPAARATLVARPEEGGLRFDIRLQGEEQTTFFAF
jgi:protocatechuate 3,4-dioxygenase alpha subunit